MYYSFVIVGEQSVKGIDLKRITEFFSNYFCAGIFPDSIDTLQAIVKVKPQLVFFNTSAKSHCNITIEVLAESFEYLPLIPYVIVLSLTDDLALNSIQNGMSDYITETNFHTIGKCLSKFEKNIPTITQKSICIKSYSDYRFLNYSDIVYLKADNNTTDFKLINGSIVTAYKTLKYFETSLPPYFIRIHKSYIVNIYFISRIHFSKSKCYLNFNEELPFSNNYRNSVEHILYLNLIGS